MSNKPKLAAFADLGEDEPSLPHKALDHQKLTQYTTGTVRKSRQEKAKEAAEAKQKEEEERAAQAYVEFLDEFEGEGAGRARTNQFVRAGQTSDPPPHSTRPQGSRFNALDRGNTTSPPPEAASKPRGKRAMDFFLEEIKREQADREAKYSRTSHGRSVTAMAAYDTMGGSRDRGDTDTCNLFVSNLPNHVSEQALGNLFATKGNVGSVKIMWPRNDTSSGSMVDPRKARSSRLSGFVSFMKRRDAESALKTFDGYDWDGSVLRVGWSKAVPIASKPMYAGPSHKHNHHDSNSRSRSRSRSREGRRHHSSHHSHSRSRSPRRSFHSRSRSRSRSPYQRSRRSASLTIQGEDSNVTDHFIKAVAAEVKGHGTEYAASLREREKDNPKYSFMLQKNHRRHAFYRGLIERDDLEPDFDDDGYNSVYSTDSGEESERERTAKTVLGKLARKRFEAMLRAMSGKRGELARCMAFCLEHAEAAVEVADIIISSLLVEGTPVPRKVARLHLICDILHNSAATVPSAWKYRQEFQSRLGIVFDHLSNIYHSFPGRITADIFKKQITAVVDVWEDWIVFPPEFTAELRQRLEGAAVPEQKVEEEPVEVVPDTQIPTTTSKFSSGAFKPATAPIAPTSATESITSHEPMDEDDLDGVPMDADDVDGVPLDDDDVDGVPMDDDDIDGIPM